MPALPTFAAALLSLPTLVSDPVTAPTDPLSWPQFLGRGGVAVATEASVPLDFGPERRVRWKTAVPPGHSSPCVVGDRLFVTGADEQGLALLCLDRRTGDVRWRRSFAGEPEPEYGHVAAAPAMATPCTDGRSVFAYFGAYGLVALDLDGEPRWEQRLPVPAYGFGAGTSPILAGGRVILARDGAPEMAILAFDADSGEEAWRIERFGFIESHSTPFLWRNSLREELVVPGTRQLWSYDPATGKPLWYVVDVTLLTCTTPTGDEDTLYFAGWSTPSGRGRELLEVSFGDLEIRDEELQDIGLLFDRLDRASDGDGRLTPDEMPESRAKDAWTFLDQDRSGTVDRAEFVAASLPGPGKNVAVAVRAGGEGDVSKTHVRWSWGRGIPYVASPLLYQGRLWLAKAGGQVTCLDAETGARILDRERLPVGGEYYMSPVGVAGHVLVAAASGTLFVLDAAADSLEITHEADFGEELYATPAVVGDTVYLRTKGTLWAFGE